MAKTTIQVTVQTLERLKQLKGHERESYNELLNKLIDEAEAETLSEGEIDDIKKSLDDVRAGRVRSIEQVAKEMGIRLS